MRRAAGSAAESLPAWMATGRPKDLQAVLELEVIRESRLKK
ncbi:MAG: hypothetical protein ACOYM3_11465 [Terrimicrobiaceae bacterium]